jgi:hypothetical protein
VFSTHLRAPRMHAVLGSRDFRHKGHPVDLLGLLRLAETRFLPHRRRVPTAAWQTCQAKTSRGATGLANPVIAADTAGRQGPCARRECHDRTPGQRLRFPEVFDGRLEVAPAAANSPRWPRISAAVCCSRGSPDSLVIHDRGSPPKVLQDLLEFLQRHGPRVPSVLVVF